MSIKRLFFAVFCLAVLTLPARAESPVVLELFTTQGCVNCPPADAILDSIVHEYGDNVIALGCHVTYFDRAGWRDTLSADFCDARHANYLRNDTVDRVYTPQMVINGVFETQGNRENLVRSGLKMGQSMEKIMPVQLALREGYIDISLPKMRFDKPVDVWLLGYDRSHQVTIAAGQNEGETITYANAVRHLTKLLQWDGRYMNMAFPLMEIPADGYAVIAQYDDQTDILAAGKVERP